MDIKKKILMFIDKIPSKYCYIFSMFVFSLSFVFQGFQEFDYKTVNGFLMSMGILFLNFLIYIWKVKKELKKRSQKLKKASLFIPISVDWMQEKTAVACFDTLILASYLSVIDMITWIVGAAVVRECVYLGSSWYIVNVICIVLLTWLILHGSFYFINKVADKIVSQWGIVSVFVVSFVITLIFWIEPQDTIFTLISTWKLIFIGAFSIAITIFYMSIGILVNPNMLGGGDTLAKVLQYFFKGRSEGNKLKQVIFIYLLFIICFTIMVAYCMKNGQYYYAYSNSACLCGNSLTQCPYCNSTPVISGIDAHFVGMCLYYTVVTITSLGYGDIVPIASLSRIVAAGISLVGVWMTAIFIGMFFAQPSRNENDL